MIGLRSLALWASCSVFTSAVELEAFPIDVSERPGNAKVMRVEQTPKRPAEEEEETDSARDRLHLPGQRAMVFNSHGDVFPKPISLSSSGDVSQLQDAYPSNTGLEPPLAKTEVLVSVDSLDIGHENIGRELSQGNHVMSYMMLIWGKKVLDIAVLLVVCIVSVTLGPSLGALPWYHWQRLAACAAPLAYMALQTFSDILTSGQAQLGGGWYQFDPAFLLVCTEATKGLFNFNLFLSLRLFEQTSQRRDAGDVACAKPKMDLDLFKRVWLAMLVPGVLHALAYLLEFLVLSKVSLTHYGAWLCTRMFFSAVLWRAVFGEQLSWEKVGAISLLFLVCCLNSIDGAAPWMHAGDFGSEACLVLIQAALQASASVANEWAMKHGPQADIHTQNCALNLTTCLISVVACALHGMRPAVEGIHFGFFAILLSRVFVGYSASLMLRFTTAVTTNFAHGLAVPVTIFGVHLLFMMPCSLYSLSTAGLVILATLLYNRNPSPVVPTALVDKCSAPTSGRKPEIGDSTN